jgi:hypothetical protein
MQFIHNDLGQRKRGEIVEVTLTSGANVRLMDSSNFSNYKNVGFCGTLFKCGRARSCNSAGANPAPEGRPATG